MKTQSEPRDLRSRIAAGVLWALLWIAVVTVIVMTWHPWVIGERSRCPAGQSAAWDGHCYPNLNH